MANKEKWKKNVESQDKSEKKEMPTNPLTEMIFLEINRKNIIFVYNRVK